MPRMSRYILVSLAGGALFAVLDGIINGNPLAQRLYAVYKPLARPSFNVLAAVGADLAHGFIMAAIYLLLYASLPGHSGVGKGLSYALGVWFFRVVMNAVGQGLVMNVPASATLYSLLTGLVEMAAVGLLFGLTLHPAPGASLSR